jgi:hypothetical protein
VWFFFRSTEGKFGFARFRKLKREMAGKQKIAKKDLALLAWGFG